MGSYCGFFFLQQSVLIGQRRPADIAQQGNDHFCPICVFSFFILCPLKENPHQSLPRLDIGDVNLLQTGHFPFCGVRSRLDSFLTDAVERSGLKNKKIYTNRFSLSNGWIHASVHPVIRQQLYYSVLLHCSLFCPIL